MDKFLNTPLGSFFKITLGVLLAALLDYASTEAGFGLGEPWDKIIGLLVISAVPIAINYLNPADARYGRGAIPAP
jgi:hypothetical protein